jgi:glycosyltransferase involved in cell wall biosynthesis
MGTLNDLRVLYAAYKHDPRQLDAASGFDYFYYEQLQKHGARVEIVGPASSTAAMPEYLLVKFYKRILHRRYAKFPLTSSLRASAAVDQAVTRHKPDAIFTIFPPTVAFLKHQVPIIYAIDTTFHGWQQQYPEFDQAMYRLLLWQEKRALHKCTRILTHSQWCRDSIVNDYGVPAERVIVFAVPSSLPRHIVPEQIDVQREKNLNETPLRLLLIGRDYRRKGINIAIEAVQQLNAQGIPAELTVCGLNTPEHVPPHVKFVGLFKKSVPEQLAQYVDLYRRAHFLIHPALFEPSGIVQAEATGFGTPTITNNTGGAATSVNAESGIVLPRNSPAEAYTQAIRELISNPARYYALCESAKARHERELTWEYGGHVLSSAIRDAVQEHAVHAR